MKARLPSFGKGRVRAMRRYYIRTFGQMAAHEAIDLGINVETDFEFTKWTSYPKGKEGEYSEIEVSRCVRQV